MLDIDIIKQISATKGVQETVVEKDYILDWILLGISKISKLKNNLVFKGGTALHKMYFSDWRFSEDLDFTSIKNFEETDLNSLIPKMVDIINKNSGINLTLREIDSSGRTEGEMWSFKINIEYIGPRKQTSGDLPIVRLHITNDELILDKPILKSLIYPCADLNENFFILTYSLEEILAEKLRTVINQRCYPRDVYDVWELLKKYRHLLDIVNILEIYKRKCSYRNIEPAIPDRFEERILRLKNQWNESLCRQIKDIPDFESAYNEIKLFIYDLFSEKYKIEGGEMKMLETHYSIKYRMGDLEIEVGGDKNFVEEKFKELLVLKPIQKPLEKVEHGYTAQTGEQKREMTLPEFMKTVNIKSHTERILVFGYYLEQFKGFQSFNVKDIEDCYGKAKIQKPKNISAYIGYLISQGYLMEASEKKDERKAWRLTQTGIDYVNSLKIESES